MSPFLRRIAQALLLLPFAAAAAWTQAKPVAGKAVADSFAIQPAVRQSWTSDKMRYGVGDIITVLIAERTSANANVTDNATDNRTKSMGLAIRPPTSPGAPSTNIDATMDFNNNGNSRKQGNSARGNDFTAQMSVRVIAVSPTGMLQIRGHKLVNIDKNQQDVVVTGWIRPQDITSATNSVLSSRIADAEIDYAQKGAIGTPKSGVLSKVLGAIWP